MSLWVRAGLLGAGVYCLHKSRSAILAEVSRDSAGSEYELKLVQVIYRHGARTPLKPLPHNEQVEWSPSLLEVPEHTQFSYTVTDLVGGPKPHSVFEDRYRSHVLKGGTFPGQLTTIGMQQMYGLGARLRRAYIEERSFLSSVFNPSEVYVRSTNILRNMESTRCLLAGLYQQQQEGPVTIVTADADSEILYPNYQGCQGLKAFTSILMSDVTKKPEVKEELKKLQQDLNIDNKHEVDFFLLMDNLVAEKVHGFPFSLKYNGLLQKAERGAIDIFFHVMGPNTRDILKMSVGPFLYTLQSNMLDVTRRLPTEAPSRKLFLYAAHDVTLIPLLCALGIFDQKWPPYASDLTLELYQHRSSKDWFARLNYNGQEQVLKGCPSGMCPLQDFLKTFSDYSISPEGYKELCSSAEGNAGNRK